MSFILSRITGRIGALVTGVDPSAPASVQLRAQLREALDLHKVLVFRDAPLDDPGQRRVASWFAEPGSWSAADGAGTVLTVQHGVDAGGWRTDDAFVVNPPQISTLRAVQSTPYGGETLVANTAAGYADLPLGLRLRADGLRVVHSTLANAGSASAPGVFEAEHPLVRVNPLTGERGLFLGASARRLVGVPEAESAELLRTLQTYVTRPENVVRVAWEPDQLVVVDNRVTQRYDVDNYDGLPRRLHRVTVAGEVPVGVDDRPGVQLTGEASHYAPVLAA